MKKALYKVIEIDDAYRGFGQHYNLQLQFNNIDDLYEFFHQKGIAPQSIQWEETGGEEYWLDGSDAVIYDEWSGTYTYLSELPY